jgi:hypothetical protein
VKDRTVKVDNGWVDTLAHKRLYKAGYSVGGFVDNGVPKYVLYRVDDNFTKVHEFDSQEELNNMIKLLIPPEGE